MTRYERLAGLDLVVEGYELERHERQVSSEFTRVTTVVALRGGGHVGRGEDVTYDPADHDQVRADLGLGWAGTFEGFSRRLGYLPLFPAPPVRVASRDYRRWAFESAALDLTLRQAGMSLADALELPWRPVRFVVSTRLDIRPWLELYPGLEFKLDPVPEWDQELIEAIAATDSVRIVDFKAFYEGTPVDVTPDPALYQAVLSAFPDAIVEDPALTDGTAPLVRAAADRVSYDAPVHDWHDIGELPLAPRYLNIKPSRFGSVRALLECIERAQQAGVGLYGGGQFELSVGRSQIQQLASLFYAEGPNDVAPMGYNEPAAVAGWPASPLAPPSQVVGFGE